MRHIPVLLDEVLELYRDRTINRFVDGTLGAGGHSSAILEAHPEMELIGIDQDPEAQELARNNLAPYQERFRIIPGNFRDLASYDTGPLDGMLLDLGVSSMQLKRDLSFSGDFPLDMRMNPSQPLTAHEVINRWSEEELQKIFRDYGEIPSWRKVAHRIVHNRPIETTSQLTEVLKGAVHHRKLHPMTLVFQAIRIAVNDELNALSDVLTQAIDLLNPGGRLAVISFHSLEDRIVKQVFQAASSNYEENPNDPYSNRKPKDPTTKLLTKKPILPTRDEIRRNRRSRSAKLRAVEKL